MDEKPTLDCQDCGKILKYLTYAEYQIVAQAPYNFIFYCDECKRDHKEVK